LAPTRGDSDGDLCGAAPCASSSPAGAVCSPPTWI
jgi:hypothetical protein